MRLTQIVEGTPAELAAVRAGEARPPEPELVVRQIPAGPAAVSVPPQPELVPVCRHMTLPEVIAAAGRLGHHMSWYQPAQAWLCVGCGTFLVPRPGEVGEVLVLSAPPGQTCGQARLRQAVKFTERDDPVGERLPDGRWLRRIERRPGIEVHLGVCRAPT